MALSEKQVSDILSRSAAGETPAVLAKEFDVSPATIKYHLKKQADAAPKGPAFTHDADHPSDDDLGIGEEVSVPPMDLNAMLANPAFAKLIDAAVTARMSQMGGHSVSPAQSDQAAFVASLAHLIEVQAMQQPGYIKPLSAEEVDRRASGLVEMKSLLRKFENEGHPPLYLLGGDGFYECTNAIEFQAGDQIRTYLPPAESFIPKNREAEEVYAAMLVWIGGPTPGIGEQVQAAMEAAHQAPPLVGSTLKQIGNPSKVELVQAPRQDMNRRRMAGTLVPERHDISLAERVTGGGPQGPVFVGDRAA